MRTAQSQEQKATEKHTCGNCINTLPTIINKPPGIIKKRQVLMMPAMTRALIFMPSLSWDTRFTLPCTGSTPTLCLKPLAP